jgi:putative flippase GtrA
MEDASPSPQWRNWVGKRVRKEELILTVKYVAVGGTGFLLELISFHLMIRFGSFHYLFASPLATLISICTMYILHRYWTFHATDEAVHSQFTVFAVVSGSGLLLNTGFTAVFVESFSIVAEYAKILAIFFTFLWNYTLHRTLTFDT